MRRKDLSEVRRRLAEEEDLILGGYEPLYPDRREPWVKCHSGEVLPRALRALRGRMKEGGGASL
jgi:hypothetical protein